MPKPLSDYAIYCCELLGSIGPVQARAMMGGTMLKCGDAPVGVIAWDTLYLKVDDTTKPQFLQSGGKPFRYEKASGKFIEMSYITPPEAALESPGEMAHWARLAFAAGRRAAEMKSAKKPSVTKSVAKPLRTRSAPK